MPSWPCSPTRPSRITSLSDASARLANAPNSDTVLAHLSCQLVDTATLDRRLRGVLAASLPRALRRGTWDIAMDLTLIAYHGQPLADSTEIYRGEPKSGTTHFHAYATAFVIRDGLRFTLAIVPVTGGTPSHEVVRQLRRRIVAAGVRIKRVLLDRGFNNAGTIRYLQSARQPFIMPQAVHGRAPRSGQLTGLRAIRAAHATGWTTYSWKPKNEHRVRVDVCVVRRRRRDRGGNRAFLYACWGVRSTPATVRRVYRLRFGIETSYRQMNQCRIRTTTRNPALRLLFVAVRIAVAELVGVVALGGVVGSRSWWTPGAVGAIAVANDAAVVCFTWPNWRSRYATKPTPIIHPTNHLWHDRDSGHNRND